MSGLLSPERIVPSTQNTPLTWGIDPSVVMPAIAEWPTGTFHSFRTSSIGAARLANLAQLWEDVIRSWYTERLTAVFIERIRGKFPKDALLMACGVIEAVTHRVLAEFHSNAAVFEISTMEWKLHATGSGKATKAAVMRWAHANGYPQTLRNQDEADALAIACAGSRLLSAEQMPMAVA